MPLDENMTGRSGCGEGVLNCLVAAGAGHVYPPMSSEGRTGEWFALCVGEGGLWKVPALIPAW